MSASDVTVISLVTDKCRDDICQSVVPSIARALTAQRVNFKRLPLTRDYIDWVINDTDTLTVAIDAGETASVLLLASRGEDAQSCSSRLANLAADLCRDYDAHTVFWNGSNQPIAVADFLAAGDPAASTQTATRIVPRKVKAVRKRRAEQRREAARMDNWLIAAMRSKMNSITVEEIEEMELAERRTTSAPLRLSAWAFSFTTALIALPLAFPLIIHNAMRGEDLRAGAMALGVAGLYAGLAQSGMAPGLTGLL